MSPRVNLEEAMARVGEAGAGRGRERVDVERVVLDVPLSDIGVGDRLRPVDPDAVDRLAESIRDVGLQSPVQLRRGAGGRRPTILVAGAHRLEAAIRLGWTRIPATVAEIDADRAELVEIDENLVRSELTVLQRARCLARRKAIYERLWPETANGGDWRRRAGNGAVGPDGQSGHLDEPRPTFALAAADLAGVSGRTVRRLVRIGEAIPAELQAGIEGTPIGDRLGDLERIAAMDREEQAGLLERIRGMAAAPATLRAALPPRPEPEGGECDRDGGVLNVLKRAWTKASAGEREAFLAHIGIERAGRADADR